LTVYKNQGNWRKSGRKFPKFTLYFKNTMSMFRRRKKTFRLRRRIMFTSDSIVNWLSAAATEVAIRPWRFLIAGLYLFRALSSSADSS